MLFPESGVVPVHPKVRVGTSGYSFKDWVGTFYPAGMRAGDMLGYYVRKFDCLEVNVTFYRVPDARLLAGMERRTPEGFAFLVKLHGDLTHERKEDAAVVKAFHEAVQPLRDAGKMRGLLAQFPYGFKNTEENRGFLARLRDRFPSDELFVEFRNLSWDTEPVFDLLHRLELGYVSVDEPGLPGLLPRIARATNGLAYVRLHGRNARNWYAQGRGRSARYDYSYSDAELREWAAKIRGLIDDVRQVYVLFNNCHAGQAPANAQAMRELLQAWG